jgi:pimeloyl-ACP methyl ester carboxylesterase
MFIDNGEGWQLHLKVTRSPEHLDKRLRPLVIVPGYGMNSFIFGFHPRGTSMERHFAERGFEVWSVNLRRQGPSYAVDPTAPPPSLRGFAETDLTAVLDAIIARTETHTSRVDVIGCSLGGSIVYAHLALVGSDRIGSVVAIGAPLRWVEIHPLLKVAFSSPALVSKLRMTGTRALARATLPYLARIPGLLSIYMNTDIVDLSHASELTRTVEDPHPRVNKDIALWIREQDMVLRGVNVTSALRGIDRPLLVVLANKDGIVPPASALVAVEMWGGADKRVLHVGDDREWYAHADLFVSDPAPRTVFTPLSDWLAARIE